MLNNNNGRYVDNSTNAIIEMTKPYPSLLRLFAQNIKQVQSFSIVFSHRTAIPGSSSFLLFELSAVDCALAKATWMALRLIKYYVSAITDSRNTFTESMIRTARLTGNRLHTRE